MRKRITEMTNKVESYNGFAGWLFFGGEGIISMSEALDLTTPAGRAMAGMLSVFAEFEREIIRERVKARIRR